MHPKSTSLRLGFVGFCPPTRFDKHKAEALIAEAFDQVVTDNPGAQITLVSGLTDVGALSLAYAEAKRRGWRTAGVACEKAKEHPLFPVDEQIIVGANWGDESETFLAGLDAMVRVGGGKQSCRETDAIKAAGKRTYEHDLAALAAA